jgi:DNA-directed RNA polymerase specialized sigma24 family protein
MPDKRTHLIGELFTRNKRELLSYFTRWAGPDDASDLLQETFVRALRYEALHEVADQPAFLQKIATNLTRDPRPPPQARIEPDRPRPRFG